ncbi:hypothetical protein K4A83_11335 [Spirulina subsalsa FACHB-351]|uniref:Transcriptional regulator n=1 Tax=Spirulina subsalsa FACHB-351 TaxID=234711 RepID=A0ABT3L7B7_9CYAN|nr:hypothetical protein [Spirulina subsalsa]MCW6036850.1 hypothetical protein [Spirulina subsalsa FACHB-351]
MTQGSSEAIWSTLPDQQARILRWMVRLADDVTLQEVANHFELDLPAAEAELSALVEGGYLSTLTNLDEELRYRIAPSGESGMMVSEGRTLATSERNGDLVSMRGNPIAIITNPSGDYTITAGETFELRVTLSNQGPKGAIIDLYIDEVSQPLRQWCLSPEERLALSPGQSSEVVFQFVIPVQAIPENYIYSLIVDAPEHYPEDTPIRHQHTLRILPPIQAGPQVNDPTFTLFPSTRATQPLPITPGQPFEVRVIVNNRSNRVDRFRLTCSDLPPDWYQVIYPEGLNRLGLVLDQDTLALNPGSQGEILLLLQFPEEISAGQYFPTVCLTSLNNRDLLLMEVMYLTVLPRYELNIELRTILGKIRLGEGLYELRVTNGGNTGRELMIQAREDSETPDCAYRLLPSALQIPQGESGKVFVEVEPTERKRRPWWGKGREYRFFLDLTDPHELPLPVESLEGTLIWQARPWWHLFLVILAAGGAIAAAIFLVWWYFVRPPSPPRVLQFSSVSPTYEAADGDFIHLNWQITHPRRIAALQISGTATGDATPPRPLVYDLTNGIPEALAEVCSFRPNLVCQNVRTDARQAGDYTFELTVVPRRLRDNSPFSQRTDTISILPIPVPTLVDLAAQIAPPNVTATPVSVALNPERQDSPFPETIVQFNWQVLHPEQLQEIRLVGRAPNNSVVSPPQRYSFTGGIPEPLRPYCQIVDQRLICREIPQVMREPGEYIFEVALVPRQGNGEVVEAKTTDTIVIEAPQSPELLEFDTTQSQYDGTQNERVRLNWEIAFPRNLRELRVIGRSPQGAVLASQQRYDFSDGIPAPLIDYCRASQERLVCQNVPTNSAGGGQYVFELSVVPKAGLGLPSASQKSNLVEVKAPDVPVRIGSFQVNGRDVPLKYIARVNPRTPTRSLRISWQVQGPPGTKVTLLPIPGTVGLSGSMAYPLSQQSGQQTLTLQGVSPSGEQVQRSLIIETIAPEPTPGAAPGSDGTPPSRPIPTLPTVPDSPFNLPPEFD